jgi:hypothetical protein
VTNVNSAHQTTGHSQGGHAVLNLVFCGKPTFRHQTVRFGIDNSGRHPGQSTSYGIIAKKFLSAGLDSDARSCQHYRGKRARGRIAHSCGQKLFLLANGLKNATKYGTS